MGTSALDSTAHTASYADLAWTNGLLLADLDGYAACWNC